MTVELMKIMENDIKRCEEAQRSKAGSENLYQCLVGKYNGQFENFEKDMPLNGKVSALDGIVNSQDRKNKKWENANSIIKWIADKGVDVGLAFLPLLMKI